MDIQISTDYITLSQLLKMTDIISSGGMAKFFLAEIPVWVNGELDDRRGRKLYPGDQIEIENIGTYQIVQASVD